MIAPREYSDHAPVSYGGTSARASASPSANSALRGRVAGQLPDVVEADERLDEAVEDPQLGPKEYCA